MRSSRGGRVVAAMLLTGLAATNAAAEHLLISHREFKPRPASEEIFHTFSGETVALGTGVGYADASVSLPFGATIQSVSCMLTDHSTEHDVEVYLSRYAVSEESWYSGYTMAHLSTARDPGTVRVTDSSIAKPVVLHWFGSDSTSYTHYTYDLTISVDGACGHCGFTSCVIEYLPPPF